jgi:hypothetical protein
MDGQPDRRAGPALKAVRAFGRRLGDQDLGYPPSRAYAMSATMRVDNPFGGWRWRTPLNARLINRTPSGGIRPFPEQRFIASLQAAGIAGPDMATGAGGLSSRRRRRGCGLFAAWIGLCWASGFTHPAVR